MASRSCVRLGTSCSCIGYWKLARAKNVLKVFNRLCSTFNSRNLKKNSIQDLENNDEKIEPNWLFLAFKKTEKSGFSKKFIKNHKTYEISLSEALRTKLH